MVGIPLLVLIGTRTDLEPPAIPLHEIVANFIVIALVIVVFWKVWEARQDKKSVSKDSSEEKLWPRRPADSSSIQSNPIQSNPIQSNPIQSK